MNRRWTTFVAGMLLGFMLAAGIAYAQQPSIFRKMPQQESKTVITMDMPAKPQAKVVEDGDLAVRIQGRHGERVVGTLMTKVDGKWVEVEFATQNVYVKAK